MKFLSEGGHRQHQSVTDYATANGSYSTGTADNNTSYNGAGYSEDDDSSGGGSSLITAILAALPGTLNGIGSIISAGHAGEQPLPGTYNTYNQGSGTVGNSNTMMFIVIGVVVAAAVVLVVVLKKK